MHSAHVAEVFSLALMTVGVLVIQTCAHYALTHHFTSVVCPGTMHRTFYPVIKTGREFYAMA